MNEDCSIFFSASTFFSEDGIDPSVSVSFRVPEVMITTEIEKRCNCGAFLLPQEQFCPVCEPGKFHQIRDETYFNIYKIVEKKYQNSPHSILILVDLDIESDDLVKLIRLLKEKLLSEENANIAEMMFFFAFVGKAVNMVRYSKGILTFCVPKCIKDIMRFGAQFFQLEEYLEFAVIQAKNHLLPDTNKKQQLYDFFSFFKESEHLSDIQDIFYFLNGSLSNKVKIYNNLPNFHLIQIAKEVSKENIEFALQIGGTFSLQTEINDSTFEYFKNCISQFRLQSPSFEIRNSNGLYIRSNEFYGPISNIKNIDQIYNIRLKYFSKKIPPSFILRCKPNSYWSNLFFSIQIQMRFYSSTLIVLSEVWERALTFEQWLNSLNYQFIYCSKLQRHAQDILKKNFINLPWIIPNWKYSLPKPISNKYKIFKKFFSILFSKDKSIIDSYKYGILLNIFYGDCDYLQKLYDSIKNGDLQNSIIIPPYIFWEKNTDIPCDSQEYELENVFIDEKNYRDLLDKILELRKKLDS